MNAQKTSVAAGVPPGIKTFAEFWPYYVREHRNPINRRLHVLGSFGVIGILVSAALSGHWLLLIMTPVCGYSFAWFGHFCFEKNKPATFRYPFLSLMSDWVMLFNVLTGRMPRELEKCRKFFGPQAS